MTPERQRVVIAELCPTMLVLVNGCLHYHFCHQKAGQYADPLSDLNVMQDVEEFFTESDWWEWEHIVANMSNPRGSTGLTIWIAQMTPAQRAEAFIRTFKRWEDAQ